MSQIHIADGQNDNILDYVTAKNIISDTHKKSLENTLETYNFITFADKSFSKFLEKRNRIIIPDEDDSLVEFVIFEAHKYRDREGYKAQVYAHASYLELKKANVIYPGAFTGTASQHGGRALNDTGWEIGIVESNRIITITFDNHTNPYEYLKRISREFEFELDFRVEHNGTKITRRIVNLVERIGTWRGREITFGKDLDGIRRVEKQDIVTALLGIAPEDEDGHRLEVLVEDEEALQRWGRRDDFGNMQHLIEPYEIQSDRSEMTEAEARQYTRTALDKRINTQVTYETTIVDLENVPGMANKKIRLGDTIKIKDEKFNPPLYLEARVFESERSVKSKGKKEIKLGDFIEYTEEQVHDVFNQLRKEIRARITRSEMVEHTYSKIEIDTKDQYVFDEGKSFAEAVGITAEDNAKQFATDQDNALKIDVEDYADQVASQAEDNAKQYAEDKSAQALQQALAKSVAKDTYNTKMLEIAGELGDKAGITYVDGRLQVVDGAIADLNAEIDTKADGSTVYTISEVDNMINNTVSVTQYQTDINGIVSDLSSQGTQIGQNTQAIGLKADQTTVNALTGTVNSHSAQLLTMADEISAKVSADYVQTAIGDIEIGGRNLLLGTRDEYTHDNSSNTIPRWDITRLDEIRGKTVTFSFDLKSSHESNGFYASISRSSPSTVYNITRMVYESPTEYRRFYYTFTFPEDESAVRLIVVSRVSNFPNNIGTTSIRNLKLEKGNKATDWTPAPEDVEAEISSLSAELSVQAGIIEAKADSSTVNALGTRVTTAETKVDAIEGQIVNKVEVNDVKSIFTQEAGSFTFDADQINFDGHVFGEDATFAGRVEGAVIEGSIIQSTGLEISNGVLTSRKTGQVAESWFELGDGSISAFADGSFSGDPLDFGGGITYTPNWYTPDGGGRVGVDWEIRTRNGDINLTTQHGSLNHNGNEIDSIVSQGSNADGNWIRYASGIQVCYRNLGDYAYTLSGNSSNNIDLSYPQNFVGNPTLSGSGDPLGIQGIGRVAWINFRSLNQSTARIRVRNIDASEIGEIRGFSFMAIGRWK